MIEVELQGNSGCRIEVIRNGNGLVVRKSSQNVNYNDRLQRQYIKQKNYRSDVFFSVKTYGFEVKNSFFSFTMEYLNGITMAEALRTIELCYVPWLGKKLAMIIPMEISRNEDANKVFNEKLVSLEAEPEMKNFQVKEAFNRLFQFDWSWASKSPCHGDLTLENMILENGKIYLIDFLDSFYDSWAIDVAKILQDADLGWHYRYESRQNNNLAIRQLCLKESILAAIGEHTYGPNIYLTVYHVLLLNVLRIIPYCKDAVTKTWINRNIVYLLHIIENN